MRAQGVEQNVTGSVDVILVSAQAIKADNLSFNNPPEGDNLICVAERVCQSL